MTAGLRSTILILAKAPVPGRVKTRLTPPLSPEQSAALAAAAIDDTLAAALAVGAERVLLALDGQRGDWVPAGIDVVAQQGESFNERLAHAWAHVVGPAVQIGMDTPQVTARLLSGALTDLTDGRHAASAAGEMSVFGAAEDGGWWVIGFERCHPLVFDGVPMSTGQTGAVQRARLERLGYRVIDQPALRDVDEIEDAVAVAAVAPDTNFARRLEEMKVASWS